MNRGSARRILAVASLMTTVSCSHGTAPTATAIPDVDASTQSTRVTVDSARYTARLDPLGLYVATLSVTIENTGPGTVYIERLCQVLSAPAADFIRPAQGAQSVLLVNGGVCSAVGYSDAALPDPIAVAPGTHYSWQLKSSSFGARGQIPEANVTGDFQLKIPILANNHRGSKVKASDYLSLEARTSPVFTVMAPP